MRPVLAQAAEVALRALVELEPDGVGAHLGVSAEDDSAATHRFEATLPGYRGWQWAVVVAAPPGADHATVSESALLPGPDALIAPEFVPWEQRVRPGDLGPGDLLAPPADDPRLVPGYVATGDPVVDEVAREVGLGRTQVLSLEGRLDAAQRWYGEYGPDTEMAKAAPSTCGLCGFYVPLAGALRESFGVCANAMGADGHVVHVEYGCGAHSDVVAPSGNGSPRYEAFDDHAVDYIAITPQETAEAEAVDAAAATRKARAEGQLPKSPEEVIAAEAATDLAAVAPTGVDAPVLSGTAEAETPSDPESGADNAESAEAAEVTTDAVEVPSGPGPIADTAQAPAVAEVTTDAVESDSTMADSDVAGGDVADSGASTAADVIESGVAAETAPISDAVAQEVAANTSVADSAVVEEVSSSAIAEVPEVSAESDSTVDTAEAVVAAGSAGAVERESGAESGDSGVTDTATAPGDAGVADTAAAEGDSAVGESGVTQGVGAGERGSSVGR
ncbi:hypothetical protein FNL39_102210 [Nocardia caishijiensis]|uniref:DUF3027 family protein n=1 Tax=Nocardia caishijiensis TaxID=184756 RepID=A0ABQ6YQN5_9NOCA|nr:hypothetical protein FNL39_102210 [Nocardia caishijiensis]